MHWYLESTEQAVKGLIALIHEERAALEALEDERDALKRKRDVLYNNFVTMDLNEDFNERQVMHAHGQAARAHEEVQSAERQIQAVAAKLGARASSYGAICGALLQIAKQGLSAQFGKSRNDAPEGSRIGSEPIRNVIWEGRNQSMHFETPEMVGARIRETFSALERCFGSRFTMPAEPAELRNLAGETVEVLGWRDYKKYLDDMTILLT